MGETRYEKLPKTNRRKRHVAKLSSEECVELGTGLHLPHCGIVHDLQSVVGRVHLHYLIMVLEDL